MSTLALQFPVKKLGAAFTGKTRQHQGPKNQKVWAITTICKYCQCQLKATHANKGQAETILTSEMRIHLADECAAVPKFQRFVG